MPGSGVEAQGPVGVNTKPVNLKPQQVACPQRQAEYNSP